MRDLIKLMKKRELEEPDLVETIEKIFLKRRNYKIKIPPPGSAVVLLVSGGLDSTIMWAYLMERYKLKVFPLFLNRGQKRAKFEEKAVDFFTHYYQKKYPSYFKHPKKMNAYIPPLEIRLPITKVSNELVGKGKQFKGIPVYSNLLVSYGVQYAYYLEIIQKEKIRTILASFMVSDGVVMKDETLTAMRVVNLAVCSLTNDYDWQIISLPLEKELGFFEDKEFFIKWAARKSFPLEKTRSCIMWLSVHCGHCISCSVRQKAFKKAGVPDRTFYLRHHLWGDLIYTIHKKISGANV